MPAKHTLHVALTEPLVRYVRDQVAAGRHVNASETIRCALLLLIEQEATVAARGSAPFVKARAHHHG